MQRMNKVSSLVLVLVIISACVVCGSNVAAQEPNETPVTFPDANLEAAIREAIDKPEGLIFTSDLDGLTSLKTKGITDLTGLEYCSNLTELVLDYNQISDLSPLASLTKLTVLHLSCWTRSETQITDLSPLQNLTKLTRLHITGSGNQISDISPLSSLTNLTDLYLHSNQISDLSPLASLTKLTVLNLKCWTVRNGTQMTDLASLQNLTELTELYLSLYQISDLSPLASLTNLIRLDLGYNQISDISPLASLANLTDLYLNGNQISDLSPLTNLTSLTQLELGRNQISDISPLASLTNLIRLDLGYNQISDISPLLSLPSLKTLHIRHGNPLSETSLKVHIPQLKKRGVSIPRPKTSLGTGHANVFLLITLVTFIAALVVVLLFPPTRGGRRRGLLWSGLIVGVVLTGVYTLLLTFVNVFDVAYLENLLFYVWIPGLVLYGVIVTVLIIGRSVSVRCLSCGKNNPPEARFCSNCNAALESTVKPTTPLSVSCHNCGHDNLGEARFCGNCGASLATDVKLPSPTVAPRHFVVRRRWILIGALAILVMILIGYGVTSLFRAPPPLPLPPPSPIPRPSPLPAPEPASPSITFPDENLEAAIRDALGKAPGEEITADDLAELTELEAIESGITDLSGLEYCTNLTRLQLEKNQISDITLLENLTSLNVLQLDRNQISDITPLENLTSLNGLELGDNQISDITPLENVTSLTRLELWGNQISDITPLASLTNLTVLRLEENEISDITLLENLTSLNVLELDRNQISDISPLVENSGLGTGDTIGLSDNNLDLTKDSEAMENIRALEDRGVVVHY